MDTSINLFQRPMNALQKQWYRLLLARKIGFQVEEKTKETDTEETYSTICQKRYKEAFHRYNQQFRKEFKHLEAMQPSAMDAMRIHRTFAITTLWPPLHSKREINLTLAQLDKVLSVNERRRLQEILKYGPDLKRF
uniref:Uncharacterized protein n=1 Tax=Glossina brevipalpis TaxID=37001 RepID=A0A1A9VZL4_9MUSC